jgi:putative flippase GtrA
MMTKAGRRVAALLRNVEFGRFLLFLLVGGLNTLVGYSIFAGLILLGARPALALTIATILGVLFNFKSIGSLVFQSVKARLIPRFLAVYVVQFLVNLIALRMLIDLGAPPLLAQLIVLPILSVATFIMMRRFVFERTSPVGSPS